MNTTSFVDRLRAMAEPGFLWRDFKALLGALALTGFGIAAAVSSEGTGNQLVSYAMILGGLAWLGFIGRRALARRDLATHPVGTALAALGDLSAMKQALDEDFAARQVDAQPLQVGAGFACFAGKAQVVVQPLTEIMWVHPEVVRHSVNMIPTGRSHQLVVWKRNGAADVLPLARSQIEPCLRKLAAAAPWIAIGYSDMLKESWNADRAEFIAAVDGRRAQVTGASPAARR